MNKKFTKLMAAIALLTFLAVPMGMWGQTTVTWPGTSALPGTATAVANDQNVTIKTSSTNTYTNPIRIYANTTVTINALNGAKILSVAYEASSTGNYVTYAQNATVTPNVTPTVSDKIVTWTYAESDNVTEFMFMPSFQTRSNGISITYKTSGGTGPTTYAVTFEAGDGTFVGNSDFPNASNNVAAGTYTLPSATPATGYTFDGWVATGITTPITGSYTVSGAVAFTAHYTQSGSSGQIATLTATNLDLKTSYPSSEQTVTIDGITYAYHYLMKSSTNIQAQATNGVIRNTTAYSEDIVSVAITHSSTARATTIWGSANGENWTSVATGSGSITADFSGKGYKYFKITRGSNAAYWTQIVITCEAASSVAKPTFNPAGGIYTSAQSVTISAESGVNIYYTTDGSQPTTNSTLYNGAISIESTTTLKAIAVVNGESSNVASATYTILNPLTTMQAIFDNATATPASHEVAITFDNWVISGQNGSQTTGSGANKAWLTDNEGKGCAIYNTNNLGLMANNVLNGTVICNLQLYNGSAQITGVNSATTDINGNTIVSTGGTITPFETTIGNVSGVSTGAVVKLNHLRCVSASTTSNTLTDGTNTIYAKKTLYSSLSFAQGKIYDLTGVFEYSSSTSTIYPRSAADVVEAPKATLAIGTLTNVTGLNVFYVYDEYNPIISEGQSSAQQQVYVGEEIKVSPEVAAHCAMQSLTVTDGDDNPITITDHMTDGGYYSFIMPSSGATIAATASVAQQYTLTVVGDHVNITQLLVGEESDIVNLDANHQASIYEQTEVVIDGLTVDAAYMIESVTIEYGNTSVDVTKNDEGLYAFTMPSSDATLTITVGEIPTYTLVTSADQLVPGKHYIIATSNEEGAAYAISSLNGTYRNRVSVTVSNSDNKMLINYVEGLYEFVLSGDNVNKWSIYDEINSAYLYGGSKGTLGNSTTLGNTAKWDITIDGNATIDNGGFYIEHNSSASRFACYAGTQGDVYLYVKDGDTNYEFYSNTTSSAAIVSGETYTVHSPATLTLNNANNGGSLIIEDGGQLVTGIWVDATVQKNITAYTSDNDGWNLISSPVNVNLGAAGIGLTTETVYDLYYLDEPTTKWINYKSSNNGFNIQPQKGYLYANAANTTLSFSGTLQPNVEGTGCTVPLSKSGYGWNLVGNPFPFNAYVNKPYYVINGRTVEVYEGSDPVPTCTGIIVKATEANETVTFRRTAFTDGAVNNGNIQMTLAQQAANRGTAATVDNAIVSFNEGSQLEKFYFGNQNANLYIPQGNKEYAIVNTEAQGEMPVNFKAAENGTYTLTVNPENVEMGYLHLIDNMTGADIDLLATPSYSFEAKTTDYESRFRLVFAANNEDGVSTGSTTFAFFSNGSWIINNEGEATLQVIDLNGRILSSETINGSVSTSLNATTGIYMMRLISGDNVKTQKVVVR